MSPYFSEATETHHRPLFPSWGGLREIRSSTWTGLASSHLCGFSRLETILLWETHCEERDLDSERPLAGVVETWSKSWLCHVLTFQTLGLSINVCGSCFHTWKMGGDHNCIYLHLMGESVSHTYQKVWCDINGQMMGICCSLAEQRPEPAPWLKGIANCPLVIVLVSML